jgi:D-alanyl-lipoteichoic acid acyltransferase DltB (MBOAT superfamily)
MLFNSHEFIFLFLPIVLAGFFVSARVASRIAALWLALASLFFYGWWNPAFVGLLVASIAFNYTVGRAIGHGGDGWRRPAPLLAFGVTANLGLLGYFKYTNFFISVVNAAAGPTWPLADIVLPLGVSFFTFTQIAYLVDVRRGKAREYNFVHYLLFVTYFPHLIAGPVLHHAEMMPQFARASTYSPRAENFSVGLTVFVIGLFKKVILADTFGAFADSVFAAPGQQAAVAVTDAWGGALAYTFQLYFDFSGYSDMAIGLSLLFGIKLPLNFASPYKAVNIIEFWRRWHMTLSRFLRDYLYIPLGGSRKGPLRRYINVLVTMLLGGLWHGAGWTFVVWGGLHGLYLVINHGWHDLRRRLGQDVDAPLSWPLHAASVALTFVAVVLGWVVFRADSLSTALALLGAMVGVTTAVPAQELLTPSTWMWIAAGLGIVWGAPNTQELMADYAPALDASATQTVRWRWSPTPATALVVLALALVSLVHLSRESAFLYFQF